jgi:hypothetical protein
MQALLPAVVRVLQRGKDNSAVFGVLEAFSLLGGAQQLLPFQQPIVAALQRTMTSLTTELAAATGPGQAQQQPGEQTPSSGYILDRCDIAVQSHYLVTRPPRNAHPGRASAHGAVASPRLRPPARSPGNRAEAPQMQMCCNMLNLITKCTEQLLIDN